METVKQSKKELLHEIIRFLLVGGLATILDYTVAYLLKLFLDGYWFNAALSNTMGHIVGLLINYFLSAIFVYRHVKNKKESKSFKAFMLFVLVDVIGLAFTILIMQLEESFIPPVTINIFNHDFDMMWLLCKCFCTFVCLIWNYIGRKKFVFK